ncbi:MAG UNVERIFIED_CONTAM: hypothetical protein LVR29_23965 [Microcystis novacekii LVE1205-3]
MPAASYTPEILARYDKIFCKSQYQRDLLDFCPDNQCPIVPNGIDTSLLAVSETVPESEYLPYRLVYPLVILAGLESMLKLWLADYQGGNPRANYTSTMVLLNGMALAIAGNGAII